MFWGWGHREGMGSPTDILLSLTCFSFAQLHTCKERREGAEHLEHPPGARTPPRDPAPCQDPHLPCPAMSHGPMEQWGAARAGGSWKELGQWEWMKWALGG